MPKADITLGDGTWLMVQSKRGVYLQQTNQLDLSRDVTLYRDDGTTVTTASASIDLKTGAAASSRTDARGRPVRHPRRRRASRSPTRAPPSNSPARPTLS